MNSLLMPGSAALILAVLLQVDRSSPQSDHWEPGPLAPAMVWIPAGSFQMGSLPGERHRLRREGPRKQVTFSQGFWIGKFEVTQEEYLEVMGYNPSRFHGGHRLPVEQVSWFEAKRFCDRLTTRERQAGRLAAGYVFRLPTEAEWEYAARAGSETRFSFGDDPAYATLGQYAWFKQNSGGTTHPAGSKCPNPWGLYDMLGNVEEWCADGWRDALTGLSSTNPQVPATGKYRVIRGGSWRETAQKCRWASREYGWPEYHENGVTGFRLVLARELLPLKSGGQP